MLSLQISVLTVYLVLLLAVTAASVVPSLLILRFHHRPDSSPVTGCLATTTMALRKLLCMEKIHPGEEEECNGEGVQGEERNARSFTGVKSEDSLMSEQTQAEPLKRPPKNSVCPVWSGSLSPYRGLRLATPLQGTSARPPFTEDFRYLSPNRGLWLALP